MLAASAVSLLCLCQHSLSWHLPGTLRSEGAHASQASPSFHSTVSTDCPDAQSMSQYCTLQVGGAAAPRPCSRAGSARQSTLRPGRGCSACSTSGPAACKTWWTDSPHLADSIKSMPATSSCATAHGRTEHAQLPNWDRAAVCDQTGLAEADRLTASAWRTAQSGRCRLGLRAAPGGSGTGLPSDVAAAAVCANSCASLRCTVWTCSATQT